MRVSIVTALLVAAVTAQRSDNYYRLSSPYSYPCVDNLCVKTERGQVGEYQPLSKCQLTCGQYGTLWPQPTGAVQLSKETFYFNPENIEVTKVDVPNAEISDMVNEATRYFMRNLHFLHPDYQTSMKTPYTQEEKVTFVKENPRQFSQSRVTLRSGSPQQQQSSQEEFETVQPETIESWERYSPFLNQRYSDVTERKRIHLEFTVARPERKLTLDTDESYNLEVKTVGDDTTVKIQAPTYFGARHALESLSQMIAYDDTNSALMMLTDATVQDSPQFKYRGFMLDTSRHFYPKRDLMRLMDAMSQNKMNYFQWHIADSSAFPMYTESRPEMSYYGAYSPRKVYYPDDIKEVVEYARLRGINVVPEFPGPGQSNAGWQWGEKSGRGRLTLCDKKEPWFDHVREPASGHLNPVNDEVYNILGDIFRDTIEYFDPDMLHMGGDDVSFKCWKNENDIVEYLKANARENTNEEMFNLWNLYQNNAYAKLREETRPGKTITPIIHSSSFAQRFIDKDNYIIQVNENANDPVATQYVQNGFKVIFANLDQWRVACNGATWFEERSDKQCPQDSLSWEHFYKNSPLDNLASIPNLRNARTPEAQTYRNNILGGIATLYSSETDANSLDSKTWPSVSAMAERLWSDPQIAPLGTDTTQRRLNVHGVRMNSRGIRANPTQPEFCLQDETACYSKEEYAARNANIPQ